MNLRLKPLVDSRRVCFNFHAVRVQRIYKEANMAAYHLAKMGPMEIDVGFELHHFDSPSRDLCVVVKAHIKKLEFGCNNIGKT